VGVTPEFWRGKRVFITGHTGFKGAWLALWLQSLGARVSGFGAGAPTSPSFFELRSVIFQRLSIGTRASPCRSCSAPGHSSKSQMEMATTSVSFAYQSPPLSWTTYALHAL